jgi:predicted phage terminase large subunit-like protein
MSNQSAKIEAGQVWLPEQAPWLETFKAEMLAFPNGKFDDQVDSVSQFIWWQEDRIRRVARYGRVTGMY